MESNLVTARLSWLAVVAALLAFAAPAQASDSCQAPTDSGDLPYLCVDQAIAPGSDSFQVIAKVFSGAAAGEAWIEYGTSVAYGSASEHVSVAASTSTDVTPVLGDLQPATAYHYRLVFYDGDQLHTSADRTMTTSDAPPLNISPPAISGNPWPGQLLVCLPGTWSRPTLYEFSWVSDGDASPFGDDVTRTVTVDDVGKQLTCRVRTLESHGSAAQASSDALTVLAAAPPPLPPPPPPAVPPVSVSAAATQPACIVPRLRGLSLARAKTALTRAGCSLGKTRHAYSSKVKRGRVVSTNPARGGHYAAGKRITLTLSKGKRQQRRRR